MLANFRMPKRTVIVTLIHGRWLTTISAVEFKKQFCKLIDEQEIEIGKCFNYGETHVWYAEVKSHKLYDRLLMADFLSVRNMENEKAGVIHNK